MKTKELIKLLQEADPSGESTVNCNRDPIYAVEGLPGYYDGPYTELIRDDERQRQGFYSVVGFRIRRDGDKVRIQTMPLEDCIWNCSSLKEAQAFKLELHDSLDELRKEYHQGAFDIELKKFEDWNADYEKRKLLDPIK